MKSKELIYIFILIVIIYFIYIYFIEKKESFVGKINESFRSTSRNVSSCVTENYNNLINDSRRFLRKTGIY
jgi:hypothetical protein